MKAIRRDDLSVIHIQEAPALWTVLPALSYKVAPRCLERRSEVVQLKDCILFAWRLDRLRRAYCELDKSQPTGELMRVVEAIQAPRGTGSTARPTGRRIVNGVSRGRPVPTGNR